MVIIQEVIVREVNNKIMKKDIVSFFEALRRKARFSTAANIHLLQQYMMGEMLDDLLDPVSGQTVCEDSWLVRPHFRDVTLHYLEVGSHILGQIDFVDDQKITLDYSWPSLSRDIVTSGNVDDEHPVVDEIQRKGRGQVVTPTFDNDEVQPVKSPLQTLGSFDVERGIFTNDGVGTGTRLYFRSPAPAPADRTPFSRLASS